MKKTKDKNTETIGNFKTKIFHIIEWIFTAVGLLTAIVIFASGNITSGFFFLVSAFVISPIFEKIPKIKLNFPVQCIIAFLLYVVGIGLTPPSPTETTPTEKVSSDISYSDTTSTTEVSKTTQTETLTQTTKATTSKTTTISETEATSTATTTSTTTTTTTKTTSATTTTKSTSTTSTSTSTISNTTSTIITTTVLVIDTQPPVEIPASKEIFFVLNTETNCIHTNENCSAAQKILPENKEYIVISEDEIGNYYNVYWACGKCSKAYSDVLPKF